MAYDKITLPADGAPIGVNSDASLRVPDRPIIPFISGDGCELYFYSDRPGGLGGRDIWRARYQAGP